MLRGGCEREEFVNFGDGGIFKKAKEDGHMPQGLALPRENVQVVIDAKQPIRVAQASEAIAEAA